MFTPFNSKSLWIGRDLQQFSRLRDVLDSKGIAYKYKVNNHLGQWAGRGTLRSTAGSFGNPGEQMYEYEVFVYSKDYEQARYLLGNL